MSGFWGRRTRDQITGQDVDLARRADAALIATDERLRLTADELAFAEAELGEDATAPLREALTSVRHHLREAFQLHQLNHDEIPDTPDELRTRNARIVQLCEWAENLIEERMSALSDRIALARRAPQILAGVRGDTVALRARLDPARAAIDRLGARYADSALRQVRSNPAEAEQLIGFAEHSARVAHDRREADQREPANLALEAATEAVRRARALLDAVDNFEIEALRAESTLGAVVDDSRQDLVVARTAPQTPEVGAAVERLEHALSALPPAGVTTDPFSLLTALREANAGLDAAIATARERAEHPIPSADQVRHAIDDADRQLAIVRDLIGGHRGWIGADARTRHAEAERIREELSRLVGRMPRSAPARSTRISESRRWRWPAAPDTLRPRRCSWPSAISTRRGRRPMPAGAAHPAAGARAAGAAERATPWAASSAAWSSAASWATSSTEHRGPVASAVGGARPRGPPWADHRIRTRSRAPTRGSAPWRWPHLSLLHAKARVRCASATAEPV